MTLERVSDAISKTIFEVILQAYEKAANNSVVVSRVWPGQRIPASQYSNPWSPTNPNGTPAVTENTSKLVDPIPLLSDTYQTSGRKVEDAYGQVVTFARGRLHDPANAEAAPMLRRDAAQPKIAAAEAAAAAGAMLRFAQEVSDTVEVKVATPDGKRETSLALTSTARDTNTLSVRYANQLAHLSALRAIQQRSSPAEGQTLQPEVDRLEGETAGLHEKLQGLNTGASGYVTSFESRRTGSSRDDSDDAAPPSITTAFSQARKKFEMSELASVQALEPPYHASYVTPDDWADKDAAAGWPFIGEIAVQGGGETIFLSLRFSRVDIIRPWFLMSLFDLPDWEMSNGSIEPGSLSNGQAENNHGTFALLPQSMIVTRDIIAVDASGATLFQAPDLQILAWVNKVMPYSPPALSSAASGSVLVTNRGAFTSRFTVAWQEGGRESTSKSGNLLALAAASIRIPAQAKDISVTVEVMTALPPLETWKTVATLQFDRPVRKCYELSGATFDAKFVEVPCAG